MEIHGMTVLWDATYCLNPDKANANTYANSVHVACTVTGALFKRSNVEGNGQSWDYLGRIDDTHTVRMADTTERDARITAHAMTALGATTNGGTYGAVHSKATMLLPVLSKTTGRKLTAASSIVRGQVQRNKNRNLAVETARATVMGCGGKCNVNETCIHCD